QRLAFAPDGTKIASGDYSGQIRLWDVRTGEGQKVMGHSGEVKGMAFSPDGTRLASVGDQTVRLFDVAHQQSLILTRGDVRAVAFSPDGAKLAWAGADGVIQIRQMPNGAATFLRGHSGPISQLIFPADGKSLVSLSNDRTVRIWNFTTGASQV